MLHSLATLMHHLILVRELEPRVPGLERRSGSEDDLRLHALTGGRPAPARSPAGPVAAVYRRVREVFGDRVRISVVDPRCQITYLPLVLRDVLRYRVPPVDALRTLASASLSSAVFDGQILFRGRVPDPDEVVARIAGRLRVHRVGAPDPDPAEPPRGGAAG